ncbi:MAG: hypothetical protein CSB33_03045 [Desulfobacterales bacterium]|nr:MAG: hypothetical protein CSB33_03045 [Desulfobacterales bacterium]
MPLITLCGGAYCRAPEIVSGLSARTGYPEADDTLLIKAVRDRFGIAEDKLRRILTADETGFNRLVHEKEFCIARFKQVLADHLLEADDLLLCGFAGQLVPRRAPRTLRICLMADMSRRVALAARDRKTSEQAALQWIHLKDDDFAAWQHHFHPLDDPLDASFFDLVLHTDEMGDEMILDLAEAALARKQKEPEDEYRRAVADFQTAANAEARLYGAGHDVHAEAENGAVTLLPRRKVLLRDRLERELIRLAEPTPGVSSVRVVFPDQEI